MEKLLEEFLRSGKNLLLCQLNQVDFVCFCFFFPRWPVFLFLIFLHLPSPTHLPDAVEHPKGVSFHSRDVECSSRCYCCVSPVDAALSTASLCLQMRLGPAPHGVGEKQEPPPPLVQVPLWKNRFSARAVHSSLSSFTHLPREHFRHARLCRRHQ